MLIFCWDALDRRFGCVDSLCLEGTEEDAIAAYEKESILLLLLATSAQPTLHALWLQCVTCHKAFESKTVWSYTRMTRAMLPRFQRGVSYVGNRCQHSDDVNASDHCLTNARNGRFDRSLTHLRSEIDGLC